MSLGRSGEAACADHAFVFRYKRLKSHPNDIATPTRPFLKGYPRYTVII